MNSPQIEYPILLMSLLVVSSSILLFLFYRSLLSLKKEETKRIVHFTRKIEHEKKRSNLLKNQTTELGFIEQSIDRDLFKIQVELINIDFTIKEICKFI
ncbi:MAG: hypothetical protein JXR05_07990 [Flavobacteriaceae bacterium]